MMAIDWNEMFGLTVSPLELFIRGTIVYWVIFAMFRTILQRDIGAVGVADVLLLVLIADAAQNAMAGEYRSITDGLILVVTIIAWNVVFDYLTFRSERLRRLLQPPTLRLVREGQILHRNLRREFMSEDELRSKLREHGIEDLAEVRAAFMESNGTITVLRQDGGEPDKAPPDPRPL